MLLFSFQVNPVQAATFTASSAAELITTINSANSNGTDDVITLTSNITLSAVDNITNGPNGLFRLR